MGRAAIGGRMTVDDLERGVTRSAGCMFRILRLSPWCMVSQSGHGSRIVREFCSVKCELVGSMWSVHVPLWMRVGRSGVDSRLRGNDGGECGNDNTIIDEEDAEKE